VMMRVIVVMRVIVMMNGIDEFV